MLAMFYEKHTYVYNYLSVLGMNANESHVHVHIPLGCFELVTLMGGDGLHNHERVHVSALYLWQGWQGGGQFAFHRPVVSTHSLELKTGRPQTPQSI